MERSPAAVLRRYRAEKHSREVGGPSSLPYLVGCGAGGFWAAASLLRLRASYGLGFDLAFYQQQVWLLSVGSFEGSMANAPVFLDHLSPVLILFAPLGSSTSLASVLVVTQAAAFGVTVGLITKRITRRELRWPALAYLILNPAMGFALLYDFHPLVLGLPVLVAILIAVEKPASQGAITSLLLASLAVREDVALLAGLLVLIGERGRTTRFWGRTAAIATMTLAAAYAVGGAIRLAALGSPLQSRYAWILDFVRSPSLSDLEGVVSFHALVVALVVYFPLVLYPSLIRRPTTVVAVLVSLFFVLGEFVPADSIYYQYQAVPVVLIAWGVSSSAGDAQNGVRLKSIVMVSVMLAALFGPLAIVSPPVAITDRWLPRVVAEQDRAALHQLRGVIPTTASVTADNTVSTYFAQRRYVYDFPDPLVCSGRFTESRGSTSYPDYVVATRSGTTVSDRAMVRDLGYELWLEIDEAMIFRLTERPEAVAC